MKNFNKIATLEPYLADIEVKLTKIFRKDKK